MKTTIITIPCLLLAGGMAHAAIVASDDFSGYTTGALVGQTPTGGTTGFTGAWTTYNGGGVNADGSIVTTATSGNSGAQHALSSTLGNTGQYYFSFSINPSSNASYFGISLWNGGTILSYAGDTSGSANWMIYDTANRISTTPIATGTTITFAGLLDYDNNNIAFWINPGGTDGYNPTTGTGTGQELLSNTFNSSLGINSLTISSNATQLQIDNFVLATSPTDVGLALIPEPSAALLGGLGLLGFLRRRR